MKINPGDGLSSLEIVLDDSSVYEISFLNFFYLRIFIILWGNTLNLELDNHMNQ